MKRIIKFFKDSYAELKKVTWPTREEVGNQTQLVVVSVIIFALALGAIDLGVITLINVLF